ncbi:hypothetical protein MMPV_001475 [Pyropia vietnamensis]
MSVIGESLPRPLAAATPTAPVPAASHVSGSGGGSTATPPRPTVSPTDRAFGPSLARDAAAAAAAAAQTPAKKKACCVCLDTKRIRDECVVMNGEEACATAIAVHKACMRAEGF